MSCLDVKGSQERQHSLVGKGADHDANLLYSNLGSGVQFMGMGNHLTSLCLHLFIPKIGIIIMVSGLL